MHVVIVELAVKPEKEDEFLKFYRETIVPFAKKKTKVKDIQIIATGQKGKLVVHRSYPTEADAEPMHHDEEYKKIKSEAAKYLSDEPKRKVHMAHSMI